MKRILPLKVYRVLAFLAVASTLAALVIGVVQMLTRVIHAFAFPLHLFEALFCVALLNAMVLAYRYLAKRWFRGMPATPRRLLIGVLSIVVVLVLGLAILIAAYALCIT